VAEAVVDDVLVDLVGDRQQVVALAEVGDRLQIGPPEDLARASRSGSNEKTGGSSGTQMGTAPEMMQPGP
jgi:hypothetical protein